MKFLFDLFPVILFFIAYQFADIFVATAVAIIATFCQIGWVWMRRRKVDTMLWVSLVLIVVFGGATLILHDKTFIMLKPTVLYWLFGAALLISEWGFKKNLMRTIMQNQIVLPEPVWSRLNLSWVGFFLFMGAVNLYVAYNFPEPVWVKFKLFGGIGLMLVFVLLQGLMLAKYVEDKETK